MFLVYNALTLLLSPVLALLMGAALLRKKYRDRIPARLGCGLRRQGKHLQPQPEPELEPTLDSTCTAPFSAPATIWVHALSVGEVSSARPLLQGIRTNMPGVRIVLSVTTRTGQQLAQEMLADCCDAIIAAPYDFYPVIRHVIHRINPQVFILVETDFWPNWLHVLAQQGVPAYLVNGRISAASFAHYRRFAFFFLPMFRCLTALCMQTKEDANKMTQLGLDPARIHSLGNLKFDAATGFLGNGSAQPKDRQTLRQEYGFDKAAPLFICGSTHAGEEELLLAAYKTLRRELPHLQLLLAPRQIERAAAIAELATHHGIVCRRRSHNKQETGPVLLLDTLGELAACYPMADLAFIGGSLVPVGGHNPAEAAAAQVPVCFGPHMEDFSEMSAELIHCQAAVQVEPTTLLATVRGLMQDAALRSRMGLAAHIWLRSQQGVVQRHLALLAAHFPRHNL
ncbi:MAG: 3-deoxy-D-manno-octulosonic acid transferase [Desulfobulbaceae bacterium]|nr:3-deoxy-D-manno-octulosonic acid transferase [Desulfobulbaceae bacterium]